MPIFNHDDGNTVRVKGADIYYEVHGSTDGVPLLLLHGGLGSMMEFNSFAPSLPPRFKLIGIDFRGQGKSTIGDATLSYAQYQEDVETVLSHLGIDAVSIIGFSDGGIVGYRLAANSTVKVNKLITLGSQWRLLPDDPALPMLKGITPEFWTKKFPESVKAYQQDNPSPDFPALIDAIISLWTDVTPTGYPDDAVQSIQSPILIMRGDNDPFISIEEATELQSRIPGSGFLNIPFAGHAAFIDSPDVFSAVINSFLNS